MGLRCCFDDDVGKATVLRTSAYQIAAARRELMLGIDDALAVYFDAALFDEALAFARRLDEPGERERLRDPERRRPRSEPDLLDFVGDRVLGVRALELVLRRVRSLGEWKRPMTSRAKSALISRGSCPLDVSLASAAISCVRSRAEQSRSNGRSRRRRPASPCGT